MFAPEGKPQIDRRLLAAKADELDHAIRKLTAMRDGLRHAAECPAPSHMECPKFRRLLGLAALAAGADKSRKTGGKNKKMSSGKSGPAVRAPLPATKKRKF